MAVPPEVVHDYYRRAALLASAIRRQATDPGGTVTLPDPTTTSASSTISSVSSVSTASTASSLSQSSLSSRSTASTRSTATASPTSNSVITSDVSSMFSSQYVTTNSSGQVVTTTIIIVPTGTTTGQSSGTPVGAIVGGVVGGVAAIALIGFLIFLIRRKMKRDEFEANIFDPDRNVERPTSIGAGPRFDLGGAGGGAAGLGAGAGGMAAVDSASHVTPYSYGPTSTGPTSTNHGSSVIGQPEMQQAPNTGYYPDPYGQNQYSQYPTTSQYPTAPVGVGEHFPNPYAPGYHPAAAGMAAGALGAGMAAHGPSRGQTMSSMSSGYPPTSPMFSGQSQDGISQSTSPPPTVAGAGAYAAQNPRSAKEREAFSRTNQQQQYSVANQGDQRNPSPTPSANRSSVVGSSVVGPTSPVVVHQDGGRIQEDEGGNEDAEIPPTYDSIPRGH